MADTKSFESFDDELLSAYVDGELDADQRVLVERRLRDDPLAKQLVEEMQGLSATLQALPREQIGRELREGVLQQIEEKVVSLAPREDRRSGSRRWVWAAMAIAATLVLTVYLPEANEEKQELAKAKPQAERRAVPEFRAPAKPPAEESLPAALRAEAELDDSSFESEVAEEVFQIHLTPADAQTGQGRFDDLLASNYIDLEAESSDTAGLKDKAKEFGAVASKVASSSPSDELSAQAEVVLVEASPAQIESLIFACNSDTKNWKSVSFGTQEDARLPVPRWRGLERRGKMVATPGSFKDLAELEAEGVAAAKATESVEVKSNLSRNKADRAARQEAFAQRGRATRLGGDWRQMQAVARGGGGTQQSNPMAQIRVLFVLHPAEVSSESTVDFSGKAKVLGKKAAAGK